MSEAFKRLEPLYGQHALQKLSNANVAVFGLGGVGGFTAEALVRSGIGNITIVDGDSYETSNLNRQIAATTTTIGRRKAQVMADRLAEITPNLNIDARDCFVDSQNICDFNLANYDVVIDAVDTVTTKLLLIQGCYSVSTEILCCLGTAGKTDPTRLKFTTIEKTANCPLARVMRRELKKRNIYGVKAIYSDEKSAGCFAEETAKQGSRPAPSSCIFVPSVAGIMLAHRAVDIIINERSAE